MLNEIAQLLGNMIENMQLMSSGIAAMIGISPLAIFSVMALVLILMVKYKAQAMLFWGFVVLAVIVLASGAIPLGGLP